jgi:putative restriction endonuclease
VTVTPELRFEVSRRIREEYDNGRQYYAMHGKQIEPPKNVVLRPDPAALSWHNDNCFKG